MQSLRLGQAAASRLIFEVSVQTGPTRIARRTVRLVLFTALSLAWPLPIIQAAFVTTGNVDPADPATWTSSTSGYIGKTASGTLTVGTGSDLLSRDGYIAYGYTGQVTVDGSGSTWNNASNIKVGYAGSAILNVTNGGAVSDASGYIGGYVNGPSATGVATVAGAGSSWTNNSELYVGYSGNGTLNINDGGAVTTTARTYVSYLPGSTGKINFNNGTFSTGTLAAATSDLMGAGTITTRGLVSDTALLFNSTASLNQTIMLNQPGQNLTVNLTAGGGDLGAGWKDNGSLTIQNGVNVISYYGTLGYHSSSTGTATITGTNSKWSNTSMLYVGCYGSGTLDIRSGGSVSNTTGYIGEYAGSTGAVTVDGANSSWTNSSDLYVGYDGKGTLDITRGAKVMDATGHIGDGGSSTLASTVTVSGSGSKWTNKSSLYVGKGTLNITNGGVVQQSWAYIGTTKSTSSSPGLVSVSGVNTTWNSPGMQVGYDGTGKLTITDGATVTVPVEPP